MTGDVGLAARQRKAIAIVNVVRVIATVIIILSLLCGKRFVVRADEKL
jgi:hypothetical protein